MWKLLDLDGKIKSLEALSNLQSQTTLDVGEYFETFSPRLNTLASNLLTIKALLEISKVLLTRSAR